MNRPKRYTKEVLLNSALIGLKLSICTASLFSGHPVFVAWMFSYNSMIKDFS